MSRIGGPLVVNFVEPCARKPSKNPLSKKDDGKEVKSKVPIPSFDEMKKSVMELGATAKTRKERLQSEEQRLVKLGCAPYKKHKAPLPIMKGMMRKRKLREAASKQAEREADIVTAASTKRRRA